jgi:hypothetical protein
MEEHAAFISRLENLCSKMRVQIQGNEEAIEQ